MIDKVSKSAGILLSAVGLLGLFTVGHSLVAAFNTFYWSDLIVHLLYLACFMLMFLYLFDVGVSSHAMFKYSLLTFGLTILLQNILFPPPSPSSGFTAAASFLAVAIIGALIVWYMGWRDIHRSNRMAVVILVALVISCALYTWSALRMGAIFTSMVITVIGIWIRPLIAACIFACYLFRMKKKYEKPGDNPDVQ